MARMVRNSLIFGLHFVPQSSAQGYGVRGHIFFHAQRGVTYHVHRVGSRLKLCAHFVFASRLLIEIGEPVVKMAGCSNSRLRDSVSVELRESHSQIVPWKHFVGSLSVSKQVQQSKLKNWRYDEVDVSRLIAGCRRAYSFRTVQHPHN